MDCHRQGTPRLDRHPANSTSGAPRFRTPPEAMVLFAGETPTVGRDKESLANRANFGVVRCKAKGLAMRITEIVISQRRAGQASPSDESLLSTSCAAPCNFSGEDQSCRGEYADADAPDDIRVAQPERGQEGAHPAASSSGPAFREGRLRGIILAPTGEIGATASEMTAEQHATFEKDIFRHEHWSNGYRRPSGSAKRQ